MARGVGEFPLYFVHDGGDAVRREAVLEANVSYCLEFVVKVLG